MKDFDGVLLVVFLVAVVATLYFGARIFLSKAVSVMPSNAVDSSAMIRDQRERMRSTKAQHDRMMQMQQQRIRDSRRF